MHNFKIPLRILPLFDAQTFGTSPDHGESMRSHHLAALLLLGTSAAALLSINCGVLLLPISVPHVIVENNRRIQFKTKIVDEHGDPLQGVSVLISAHSRRVDPLVVEADHYHNEERTVDGELDYDAYGQDMVNVAYKRKGYGPGRYGGFQVNYTLSEPDALGPPGQPDVYCLNGHWLNVIAHPNSIVVLSRQRPLHTPPP